MINNIIFTSIKNSQNTHFCIVNDLSANPNELSLENAKSKQISISKDSILISDDFQIHIDITNEANKLIHKINTNSTILNQISEYTLGMQVYHNTIHKPEAIKKRIYHSDAKLNKTFFPECGGSNVSKYHLNSSFKQYVSYGEWCYNKPDWRFCSQERILIREIPDKNSLVCCLTDKICIPNKAVIIVIAKAVSNLFLLGLLNSNVIGYYTFNSTEKGKQRLFPRISLSTIKNLPIPYISKSNQNIVKSIEEIADIIIHLNSKSFDIKVPTEKEIHLLKIKHYETRINKLVYQLYELTPEEIKIVEESVAGK